jgi:protein TonB
MAVFYSEGVYRVGGGVSVPRLLTSQAPEYTAEARTARIEGFVGLVVTIAADGTVCQIRVEKSLGHGLDEKAIECLGNWRFRPGVLNGKPVPVAANLYVFFSLQRGGQRRQGKLRTAFEIDGE